MNIQEKFSFLQEDLKQMGKILIAYSGGVDSTFLVKVAHDVLGKNAKPITARSSTFPEKELQAALAFSSQLGLDQQVIESEELDDPQFCKNPANRCYLCKKMLFGKIIEKAEELNISCIIEGSNYDDIDDYRPGIEAIKEYGIYSPLIKAKLTKEEIRILSRELGLPTWDKPSFACLSSRIPYGEEITKEKLKMIEAAEQYLLDLGFKQVRVRHHGKLARIEVLPEERAKLVIGQTPDKIYQVFSEIGFIFTALDIRGYRTGSMNEELNDNGQTT